MNCRRCGTENKPGRRYCEECGADMSRQDAKRNIDHLLESAEKPEPVVEPEPTTYQGRPMLHEPPPRPTPFARRRSGLGSFMLLIRFAIAFIALGAVLISSIRSCVQDRSPSRPIIDLGKQTYGTVVPEIITPTKVVANIDEMITNGDGVQFRVVDVEKEDSKTDPERQNVSVNIAISNTGEKEFQVEPDKFKLRADGTSYKLSLSSKLLPDKGTLEAGTLEPGEEMEGKLAFNVPKNSKELVLEYYSMGTFLPESTFDIVLE